MDKLQSDISEMKADVKELLKHSAIHNELLREHERRSDQLEKRQDVLDVRLSPLEKHQHWINIVLGALGAILIGFVVQLLAQVIA